SGASVIPFPAAAPLLAIFPAKRNAATAPIAPQSRDPRPRMVNSRGLAMCRSRKLAAQDDRVRSPAGPSVIGFAPADLVEMPPCVEPPRRDIVEVDREKDRGCAAPGERPQMQVEQSAGKPSAPPRGSNRDGEDLGLIRRQPGEDEAVKVARGGGAMCEHVAIEQKPLEFVLGP